MIVFLNCFLAFMPTFRGETDPVIFDRERYTSPFDYRYGSDEMHRIWGEKNRLLAIRRVWYAVAIAQHQAGLITAEQLGDLRSHLTDINVADVVSFELDRSHPRFVGHDGVAASMEYADKAKVGGSKIGQGMTTEDAWSSAEIMLVHEGLDLLDIRLVDVLSGLGSQINRYKSLVCLAQTHLQYAEPTTVGYRLANYAQSYLETLKILRKLRIDTIKSKGIKGAVGTYASFKHLLEGTEMSPFEHEKIAMDELGLDYVDVSTQTYPREFAFDAAYICARIALVCHKVAADFKLLQASGYDEWAEPRGRTQVGSFAMPHKENPNIAEGVKGLAREAPFKMGALWLAAADATLERGLEDSSGKRSSLPELFLIADEALVRINRIVRGMQVREESIARNLKVHGPFAALEIILSKLSRNPNVNRREVHESLRVKAVLAKEAIRRGDPNPLEDLVCADPVLLEFLSVGQIMSLFASVEGHIGEAVVLCERMVEKIKLELES